MTSISRSSSPSPAARLVTLALGLAMALFLALVLGSPAQAVVTEVNNGTGITTVGLQPHQSELYFDGTGGENSNNVPFSFTNASSFENASAGPVLHTNNTYAIYWDPTDHYHGDWQGVIDTFLQALGAESGALSSVFSVDTQYTDKTNLPAAYSSTFRGAYTDTTAYPSSGCEDPNPLQDQDLIGPIVAGKHTPVCLTDRQIREELEAFVSARQHTLQTGMGSIFYLLTPPGVAVCIDGGNASHCSDDATSSASFCSYHSDINPTKAVAGDEHTILYSVIPWSAGGRGDYHLSEADESSAYDCQDGGFDPSSKPIEQKEKKKVKGAKEQKEFEEKSPEEQRKIEEGEGHQGPHSQEPNQVPCPSPDGGCDTGLADLIVNQIAVEQQNTVTDPLLNAWQDSIHNEATDECRNFFAPATGGSAALEGSLAGTLHNQTLNGKYFYLNTAFNLAALRLPYPGVPCLSGTSLVPSFTSPNPVSTGQVVSFDGMESDITLNSAFAFSPTGAPVANYAKYTWNFGDGTPTVTGYAPGAPSVNSPGAAPCAAPWLAPCAGSTFHSYLYGGVYQVTLTVTDVGGHTATVTNPITVDGSSPPSGEPGKEAANPLPLITPISPSSPVAPATSSQTSTTTNHVTSVTVVANPVASTAIASRSLGRVLRSGLVVRYSVNEQVAGRFEVLLNAGIARRLGIHGPRATGLPAGSTPSIMIAKAILVTTRGGRNTVKILLGKRTAARLHRLRKVTLTLRTTVRNASQTPKSTTVVTTVTLHR